MQTIRKLLLIAVITSCLPLMIAAQVTIGDNTAPLAGCVLDLKTKADGTSDKGLALPRMKLTDKNTLTIAAQAQAAAYRGVMVYNTDKTVMQGEGIYTWDGAKWNPAKSIPQQAAYKVTPKARVGSLVSGKAIEWGAVQQEVEVDVTETGPYTIRSKYVNGVVFSASGAFEKTGKHTIHLMAAGIPGMAGNNFPFEFEQAGNTPAGTQFVWYVTDPNDSGSAQGKISLTASDSQTAANSPITVSLNIVDAGLNPVLETEISWYVDGVKVAGSSSDISFTDEGKTLTITRNSYTAAVIKAEVARGTNVYFSNALTLWWITGSIQIGILDDLHYEVTTRPALPYAKASVACTKKGPGWRLPTGHEWIILMEYHEDRTGSYPWAPPTNIGDSTSPRYVSYEWSTSGLASNIASGLPTSTLRECFESYYMVDYIIAKFDCPYRCVRSIVTIVNP